jgi:hypothetical protein
MWEAGWVGSLGRLSGWLSVSLGLGDGPMNLSSRVMNIIYIYIYIYIYVYIYVCIYICYSSLRVMITHIKIVDQNVIHL